MKKWIKEAVNVLRAKAAAIIAVPFGVSLFSEKETLPSWLPEVIKRFLELEYALSFPVEPLPLVEI